jgi:cell division protein FtsB
VYKDLEYYFSIPIVRFGIHLVIWLGIILNISTLLNYNQIAQQKNQKEVEYEELSTKNNILENQNEYWKSSLYIQKFAKINNYKKPGEVVVNTFGLESLQTEPTQYYPEDNKLSNSNVINWLNCISNPDYNSNNLETFLC